MIIIKPIIFRMGANAPKSHTIDLFGIYNRKCKLLARYFYRYRLHVQTIHEYCWFIHSIERLYGVILFIH